MLLSICVCTYKRPDWLRRLLVDLAKQDTKGAFTFEIVVADNDAEETGKPVVAEVAPQLQVKITYAVEPRRSISHVRNKTLELASGEAIVFIDDDEFPDADWLYNLFACWQKTGCSGVLGPVRPYFDEGTPEWVKKGGFYNRPEHPTGYQMPWQGCRTGNVLFDRSIIKGINPVFLPEFGAAGGDVNFFWRMMQNGHRFVWCNEAAVSEIVPPTRCTRSFMLKRALLRGGNYLKHPEGKAESLLKSAIAVPAYTAMLPFLQLAGHHYFMKYLVKWCDHTGRLLSLFGIRLVKQRQM